MVLAPGTVAVSESPVSLNPPGHLVRLSSRWVLSSNPSQRLVPIAIRPIRAGVVKTFRNSPSIKLSIRSRWDLDESQTAILLQPLFEFPADQR